MDLSQTTAKMLNRPSSYEHVAPLVLLQINPMYEEAGQRSVDEIRKSRAPEYDSLRRHGSGQPRSNSYKDVQPNNYESDEPVTATPADNYSHIEAGHRYRTSQTDAQDYSSLQRDHYSHLATAPEPVRTCLAHPTLTARQQYQGTAPAQNGNYSRLFDGQTQYQELDVHAPAADTGEYGQLRRSDAYEQPEAHWHVAEEVEMPGAYELPSRAFSLSLSKRDSQAMDEEEI